MKKILLTVSAAVCMLTFAQCSNAPAATSSVENTVSAETSATSTAPANSTESAISSVLNTATGDVLNYPITLQEAVKAFETQVPNGTVASIELDFSFADPYYKVKGFDTDTEYTVQVNPETGEASIKEKEKLENDEKTDVYRTSHTLDLTTLISLQDAAAKAIETKPGTITDWELEMENGVAMYEFSIRDGNKDWDVKVNATTGQVTELDH